MLYKTHRIDSETSKLIPSNNCSLLLSIDSSWNPLFGTVFYYSRWRAKV